MIEKASRCSSSQRTLYRKQIQPRGDLSQIEIVLTVYWLVETNDSKSERIVLKTEGLNKRIQIFTIPEFTKERYLSRVAKARALVPLREKFAHFLFSSYLFFYFIFHLLCYISVSHKVCSFQWCQKFDMLHWEIKIGSQNSDSEWLCKSQPYPRVQNQWLSSQSGS